MSGLAAIGAGLGGFADYWQRQQQQNRENAALAFQLQAIQQRNQAAAAAWPAVIQGLAQQQQAVPQPQTQVPQTPVGTGMGGAALPRLFGAIESGNNPNAPTTGPGNVGQLQQGLPFQRQFLNPALSSPTRDPRAQTVALDNFASQAVARNPRLSVGDLYAEYNAGTGTPGSGPTLSTIPSANQRNFQRKAAAAGISPDTPAAEVAGDVAAEPNPQQELLGTLRNMVGAAQSSIDPIAQGRASLKAVAQAIEQANPDAPPIVKMMALEQAQKLLAPSEQVQLAMMKEMYQDQFRIGLAELQGQLRANAPMTPYQAAETRDRETHASQTGWQIQQLPADPKTGQPGALVRVNANTGEVLPIALPAGTTRQGQKQTTEGPELSFPDKWEGMPDTPPPGVKKSVWSLALTFARTNQPPPMGFGNNETRNDVFAALPAAQHALGIKPSAEADVGAAYQAERHGSMAAGTRVANIEYGINEALKYGPQVVSTSKSVERTPFPPLNQFTNWLSEKSGDPNIIAFRAALNTYLNNYAAVVSRTGRLTDSQQRHAYELLSTAFNQGQIERGIQQLDYEMQIAKESAAPTMEDIQQIGQPPALRKEAAPAAPPQSSQPLTITSQKGYDALAPGAHYIGPDGKPYIKGGQQ